MRRTRFCFSLWMNRVDYFLNLWVHVAIVGALFSKISLSLRSKWCSSWWLLPPWRKVVFCCVVMLIVSIYAWSDPSNQRRRERTCTRCTTASDFWNHVCHGLHRGACCCACATIQAWLHPWRWKGTPDPSWPRLCISSLRQAWRNDGRSVGVASTHKEKDAQIMNCYLKHAIMAPFHIGRDKILDSCPRNNSEVHMHVLVPLSPSVASFVLNLSLAHWKNSLLAGEQKQNYGKPMNQDLLT
jgi:hypothetical protein